MKKVVKQSVLLTIVSFLSITLYGQYRDGYVVYNNGDSVNCKIKYKENQNQYKVIDLILEGSSITLGPENVNAYGYHGDHRYITGIVENQFVRVLVQGELSLYKHNSQFVAHKGGKYYQLDNSTVKQDNVYGELATRSDKWKGVFSYLISDCSELVGSDNKLKFTDNTFTKYVIKYNECVGSEYASFVNKRKIVVAPGILAGYTQTRLVTKSKPLFYPWLADSYLLGGSTYGIQANISSPNRYSRMAVVVGFQFFSSNVSASNTSGDQNSESLHQILIDMNSLVIPLSFKYHFRESGIRPYMMLGMLNNFNLNSETRRRTNQINAFGVEVIDDVAFTFNSAQFGLLLEGGLAIPFEKLELGVGLRASVSSNFVEEQSVFQRTSIERAEILVTLSKKMFELK